MPADPDPISTARKPQICLRLANATATNKNETVSLQERFEIVSLTGTISRHGCHLHMALADHQGNVVGGHVLEGCEVFTTAEIVIGECVNQVFSREHDEDTGFDELVVTTKLSMQVPKRRSNSTVSASSMDAQSDSPALRQRSNGAASNRGVDTESEFTFNPNPGCPESKRQGPERRRRRGGGQVRERRSAQPRTAAGLSIERGGITRHRPGAEARPARAGADGATHGLAREGREAGEAEAAEDGARGGGGAGEGGGSPAAGSPRLARFADRAGGPFAGYGR